MFSCVKTTAKKLSLRLLSCALKFEMKIEHVLRKHGIQRQGLLNKD